MIRVFAIPANYEWQADGADWYGVRQDKQLGELQDGYSCTMNMDGLELPDALRAIWRSMEGIYGPHVRWRTTIDGAEHVVNGSPQ